jgi:hypothetical protein
MGYALAVLATFREMKVRQKIMLVLIVLFSAVAAYHVIEDWDGGGRWRLLEGLAAGAVILAVVGLNQLVLTGARKCRNEHRSVRRTASPWSRHRRTSSEGP